MGLAALLVDEGVDEEAHLVGGLLGLACGPAAENDDGVVDEVDLVSDPVDGVGAAGGGAWVGRGVRESAQAMTPLSYLMAMMVVPMSSTG